VVRTRGPVYDEPVEAATGHEHDTVAVAGSEWWPHVQMTNIPFGTTEWSSIQPTTHRGSSGIALWRTQSFGELRVRLVEYSPGYVADHWCSKGHILLCLEGELHTELADGRTFVLTPGMSYQVADNAEPHRSSTRGGAKLFIVD
jgi:hypothetical protein